MPSNTRGSILLSTAENVGTILKKKLSSPTGFSPSEWADAINLLGALPVRTVSGSIAHFEDGADTVPLKSSKFYITPTQASGTPTPSNPLPISGHTGLTVTRAGANLCGGNALLSNCQNYLPTGTTDTVNKTFKFTSGTATADGYSFSSGVKFKENTAYTVILSVEKSNTNSALNMRIRYTDGTNLDFSMPAGFDVDTKYTVVFTSNASKTILDVRKSSVSGGTTLYYEECGVFEGTLTATDFEPYTATTYPVSWSEQGTVYGGEVETVGGELTDKFKGVALDDVSLTWDYNSTQKVFRSSVLTGVKIPSSTTGKFSGLCSLFSVEASTNTYNNAETYNNTIAIQNNGRLIVSAQSFQGDVDSFKSALSGQMLVIERDTPTTTQITPVEINSLLGVNNIWCDTGDCEVEYRADIDLLISNLGG